MEKTDKKFAVLIDADNISSKRIKGILDEIANYGTPTIKRIYGNFTDNRLASWKDALLDNSIIPIQQYAYTTGKNATDSALIIDAMDILHKESVDGFCIVSSDSDYTRLASRLREAGKEVLGFGEKKTPQPFIKSCYKFIYVEILGTETPTEKPEVAKQPVRKKKVPKNSSTLAPAPTDAMKPAEIEAMSPVIRQVDENLRTLLSNTIEDIGDDSGWAFLGSVGGIITKKMPDFDPRNYGYNKLTPLVKSLSDIIEIEERPSDTPGLKYVYIRNKSQK